MRVRKLTIERKRGDLQPGVTFDYISELSGDTTWVGPCLALVTPDDLPQLLTRSEGPAEAMPMQLYHCNLAANRIETAVPETTCRIRTAQIVLQEVVK